MSGYDCGYVLRDGVLVGTSADTEVMEWHRRHPDPTLLVTPVLGVEVVTSFTGWLSGRTGRTLDCSPLKSFVRDHRFYGTLGHDQWEGALGAHEEMVSFVVHRWFCTAAAHVFTPGPLAGKTRITDVAEASGCFLPVLVSAARFPAGENRAGSHSLRWRLLHGLDKLGSANWFEINRALETTPEKCLSSMSSAWEEGLLVRPESDDPWTPPNFSLSAAGRDRLQRGDFSTASRTDDQWEPGWEPWMQHGCPVCGGFLGKTGRGNLICVADACQPGQAYKDRHYEAVLENGELVEATARQGAREYYVSYAESRHEKRKDGKILRAAPGIPSAQRVRDYVRSAFV